MRLDLLRFERIPALGIIAALFLAPLPSCAATPAAEGSSRVYHCIATDMPVPPPHTPPPQQPLERFGYGDYLDHDRPTTGRASYCNILQVPKTAYLRYRVDGRVVEKHFALSSLTAERVRRRTVEFYVDGDTVEVRLATPRQGNPAIKEVLVRQ